MTTTAPSVEPVQSGSAPAPGDSGLPRNLEKGSSLWRDAWRRLAKNRMALASLIFLVFISLLSLFAPFISPYEFEEIKIGLGAVPPLSRHDDSFHFFGTDELGRDLFTRVLQGGRVSLAVGLVATATALIIGVTYGAVSGFAGGRLDAFLMRIVDILYALPFTMLVIVIMSAVEQRDPKHSLYIIFFCIGAVEWLTMSRIVRGQVMSLRQQEFVEAAISLGLSRSRILFRHILPNVFGPVIVYTTLTIPAVMLFESILSFLGFGVQAPMSSWGSLIKDGADKIDVYPWLLIFPGIFFSLTLFALNFLGDGLRDALDPKTSKD
ncbi:MAG TPA: ABC transporter permease [Verrucomicrobiales bacterium]|nr:ABC transporter permease [Verrucomicrobiales bacterium]